MSMKMKPIEGRYREAAANSSITDLLNPQQVANTLGVTVQTLATWRSTKRYPLAWISVGRSIKYRPEDIEAFIEANLHRPCSTGGSDAH